MSDTNLFSYEALKDNRSFQAFCRRRINGKVAKPKRFKVPIPKRSSIHSVLGPYTTGRMVRAAQSVGKMAGSWEEQARIIKVNGEFTSELVDERTVEVVPQVLGSDADWIKVTVRNDESLVHGVGRWIKVMFAGKCRGCGREVKADEKAFWYKETRVMLCQTCKK